MLWTILELADIDKGATWQAARERTTRLEVLVSHQRDLVESSLASNNDESLASNRTLNDLLGPSSKFQTFRRLRNPLRTMDCWRSKKEVNRVSKDTLETSSEGLWKARIEVREAIDAAHEAMEEDEFWGWKEWIRKVVIKVKVTEEKRLKTKIANLESKSKDCTKHTTCKIMENKRKVLLKQDRDKLNTIHEECEGGSESNA